MAKRSASATAAPKEEVKPDVAEEQEPSLTVRQMYPEDAPEVEEAEVKTDEPVEAEAAAPDNDKITVCDEVLDLVRVYIKDFDQNAKEDDQKYLNRLLTALYKDVPEDQFETLSTGAQDWYNTGTTTLEAESHIAPPEGFISKYAPSGRSAQRKAGNAPKTSKPEKVEKAEKTAKAEKPAKAPKEPKAKKAPPPPRGPGKSFVVRKSICANPKITLAELLAKHPDVNKATVATLRADVAATIAAAKEVGLLPA